MPPNWSLINAASGGLKLTLLGDNNETLEGTIHIDNSDVLRHLLNGNNHVNEITTTTISPNDEYDPKGASAYAIVVIFVYGFSIVLLIASHIFLKKKQDKRDGENEKEIDKYLEQAPALQRFSEKESFRRLKHSIIPLVSLTMLATTGANAATNNTLPPGKEGVHVSPKSNPDGTNKDGVHKQKYSRRPTDVDHQDEFIKPLLLDSPPKNRNLGVSDIDYETSSKPSDMPTIYEENECHDDHGRCSPVSPVYKDMLLRNTFDPPAGWKPTEITQKDPFPKQTPASPSRNPFLPPTVRVLDPKILSRTTAISPIFNDAPKIVLTPDYTDQSSPTISNNLNSPSRDSPPVISEKRDVPSMQVTCL